MVKIIVIEDDKNTQMSVKKILRDLDILKKINQKTRIKK